MEWERWTGETDQDWSVVHYSNGETWFFDNAIAERVELLGVVKDGLVESMVFETSTGSILALYSDGPQAFSDLEAWKASLSDSDLKDVAFLL